MDARLIWVSNDRPQSLDGQVPAKDVVDGVIEVKSARQGVPVGRYLELTPDQTIAADVGTVMRTFLRSDYEAHTVEWVERLDNGASKTATIEKARRAVEEQVDLRVGMLSASAVGTLDEGDHISARALLLSRR